MGREAAVHVSGTHMSDLNTVWAASSVCSKHVVTFHFW